MLQEDTLTSCLGGSHLISTETGLESKLTQSKVDLLRPRLKSDKKKRKTEKVSYSLFFSFVYKI